MQPFKKHNGSLYLLHGKITPRLPIYSTNVYWGLTLPKLVQVLKVKTIKSWNSLHSMTNGCWTIICTCVQMSTGLWSPLPGGKEVSSWLSSGHPVWMQRIALPHQHFLCMLAPSWGSINDLNLWKEQGSKAWTATISAGQLMAVQLAAVYRQSLPEDNPKSN